MKIGLPTVIQYVLRGGYNFICLLSKASFARRQIKNPALRAGLFIVPKTGFEPARRFQRYHLKVVRLPISPPGPVNKFTEGEQI